MKYLVVIEETETGFSAYSPDLPGCVATGSTMEEVEQNMQEGILFHLEGIQEDGHIILGLKDEEQPIAAILLSRQKTHQILKLFSELADKAGWSLDNKAAWMETLKYVRGSV